MPDHLQVVRRSVFYQLQQGIPVHVFGDEISEAVKLRFASGGEGRLARRPVEAAFARDEAQEAPAESVGLHHPVPGSPEDRASPATLLKAVAHEEGLSSAEVDPSVPDLVPRHLGVPEERRPPGGTPEQLLLPEDGRDGEEPETRRLSPALDAIQDTLPEHLVAAADAQSRE